MISILSAPKMIFLNYIYANDALLHRLRLLIHYYNICAVFYQLRTESFVQKRNPRGINLGGFYCQCVGDIGSLRILRYRPNAAKALVHQYIGSAMRHRYRSRILYHQKDFTLKILFPLIHFHRLSSYSVLQYIDTPGKRKTSSYTK